MLRQLYIAGLAIAGATAAPSYNDEVRPLLSANCFKCHGPDSEEQKGGTRLDVPGEADLAEVVARINSSDPDEIMPPPEANKRLTAKQIDTLEAWIDGGAKYEKHWAFVKPVAPEVSADAHPIDQLFSSKGASADSHTLIRRLHLDLVGLPPTLEEADAFAADPSADAYRAAVDRLLASPRYGERWARRWLDLARYADTNGYEKDRDRSIWPYRDWVVRALNADMPFDQFTVEQLAGDLLPNATPEQRTATGFHRNTMLNEEGGIDPLEFRFHAMTDRVATTGTTWLGLTTGCAQCHTHKYDPITHHDYYGMMAYLNNADEPDLILDPGTANRAEADSLVAELAASQDEAFEKWLGEQGDTRWTVLEPATLGANVPYLVNEGGGTVFVGGDTSKHDVLTLTFPASTQAVRSLRLDALPDDRLPDGGPGTTFYEGRKGDFYLTEFKVRAGGDELPVESATETYAKNKFGNNPVSAALAADGDIQTGWSVAGAIGQRHAAVFVLAEAIPAGTPFAVEMHFGRHYASTLGKFILHAAPAEAVATTLPPEVPADAPPRELARAFLEHSQPPGDKAKRYRELTAPPRGTTTLVMKERPPEHPRPTFLHHRGEYTQPKEQVPPRLPDAIFPEGAPLPKDRLEFARWLVSDDNPLTARVVANRHWAAVFGEGIVPTLDDFGMQGKLPTHPELLDYLAIYLRENGWSIKSLHRHIVTSAAYRAADFPRQRLEAEIIRDSALRAAGVLNEKMFGPPVRPPQPAGVTEVAYGSPKWNPSGDAESFRRSLYTYQKRTAPFAMFTTFDAGSGEACIARRDRSNTPLQALTLMNDPMFIEVAEKFGKTIAASEGDTDTKITRAFRRVLTRPPTTRELASLRAFHAKHTNWAALARALLSLDEAVTKG